MQLLFKVFVDACTRQSVAITTNLEFGRWDSVHGDDQMTSAIIDRDDNRGRLIHLHGESYAVHRALMRKA